jgi:hypothetical protein
MMTHESQNAAIMALRAKLDAAEYLVAKTTYKHNHNMLLCTAKCDSPVMPARHNSVRQALCKLRVLAQLLLQSSQ